MPCMRPCLRKTSWIPAMQPEKALAESKKAALLSVISMANVKMSWGIGLLSAMSS